MYTVQDRFLKYVQWDTQADPNANTAPSSKKQLALTNVLAQELDELGIEYTQTDQGYIYATIPANTTKKEVPSIFFCAHLDTAPDVSGKGVKPKIHADFQGEDIQFEEDPSLKLTLQNSPELKDYIGQDIITASGKTLLGADDKSGVAVIMDMAYQIIHGTSFPHGKIMLFFTTDEEIGRGVAHVDLNLLDCSYGYTLDSGPLGHAEQENFSADAVTISIEGVSAHPGYAKGKMENAIKIASAIIEQLPEAKSPEQTSGKQGFIHPTALSGELEQAEIKLILRSFDTKELDVQYELLQEIATSVLTNYPKSTITFDRQQQYRNMYDVMAQHPQIMATAIQAMKNVGIEPKPDRIRGGTDGAMLTQKGLPCPNLFSGQHNIHSKLEWTSIQEMQKAVDMVVEICKLTEQNAS